MTIEDEIGKLEKIMTFHDTDKAMNLKEGEHCWCRDCDDNRIRLDILYKWQADRQRLEDEVEKWKDISTEKGTDYALAEANKREAYWVKEDAKKAEQLAEANETIAKLKNLVETRTLQWNTATNVAQKQTKEIKRLEAQKPALTAEDVEKER